MGKFRNLLLALAGAAALTATAPALGLAAAPVINEHFNFTSDPYVQNWCGIEGTSVDRVVGHFKLDASGASIENIQSKSLFTATASGKSMEIHITGLVKVSAPIDNGDGTFTVIVRNMGSRPQFKLPNGPLLVRSGGQGIFGLTFDSSTGEFISFEVIDVKGPHPAGCDIIVAALT
jgi:hypothetical protein